MTDDKDREVDLNEIDISIAIVMKRHIYVGTGISDIFGKIAAKITGKTAQKIATKAAEKGMEKI